MIHEEFVKKLIRQREKGRLNEAQMLDLLIQKAHFDSRRHKIEKQYQYRIVGFVNGQMQVADTVQELLVKAEASFPGKLVYFEAIGSKIL